MSDTKLDPRSLNAEERALFHQVAIVLLSSGSYKIRGAQLDALTYVAESRNLFGQGESEAKATREVNRLPKPSATDVFATDRAIGVQAMNAEDVPAATEMPEAVMNAWKALRKENYETFALALEFWWRTHAAQPVKAPRPKLEKVREFINGVSNAWLNSEGKAKKLQALAELDAFEKEG